MEFTTIMCMRKISMDRETKETKISIQLDLDGEGISEINTGIPFFDHLLVLFAKHSYINLSIFAKGDLEVDDHHTVEDIGICLGQAIKKALGDKKGIKRYASILLPMDEALVSVAVDISGRPFLSYKVDPDRKQVKEFEIELVKEFLIALVNNTGITLHIEQRAGENTHHILEAVFKGLARVIDLSTQIRTTNPKNIPSSKGIL